MSVHFEDLTEYYISRLRKRFSAKFTKADGDDCWLWHGAKNSDGYGTIGVGKSKGMVAHRVSYFLAYGSLPDKKHVLHKCDVRNCVRPDHLFLGTHTDNMRDMHRKGRNVSAGPKIQGENNPASKLNEAIVREMRKRHQQGETMAALSREFGVSKVTGMKAIKGETWQHVM